MSVPAKSPPIINIIHEASSPGALNKSLIPGVKRYIIEL